MEQKIQAIAEKIAAEFRPEKIILFGSWAWGKPHPESDLDFFVLKDTHLPTLQRIEVLDRLFPRRDFPMDFLVYTPAQVARRMALGDVFVQNIIAHGKVLYDASNQPPTLR